MSQSDTMGYSSSTPSFPSSANAETTAGLHAAPLPPLPPTAPSVPSSATEGTHEGSQSRKRKEPSNKSKMWQYFTRCKLPDGQIDPKYCTCNYCHERVLCLTEKNGTSSMLYHSKRCEKHPCYQKSKESDPTQTRLSRDNVSGGTGYRRWNKKRCDDKCIEMIIKDELPFRFVEREGFRALCNELEPQWTVLDRKQVAKGVLERFNTEKSMLLSQLKRSDTRVSITTDTWTSIQNINYMVVTAHFLDHDWVLHKRIINFCNITSHKGEDIGRTLEQCLRQWEINKVFTITVDNASANDVAVQYMKRRLTSYQTLMFKGEYLHLRCACHIINLIVKDGLKELETGIAAIWNCAKYVRSSSQRLDKFREFAILEQCKANANVPLDVITRWNSTYLMLEAALKYELTFNRMCEEDEGFKSYFADKVGPPTSENWRYAAAFCVFLKKFYVATLRLSAWKSITSNVLFVEMITLQCEINKACISEDPVMKKVAASMKTKFDTYWGSFESINKIVLIANVLDPRYKLQWAKMAMKKINASPITIQSIEEDLKKILMKMYEEYKGCEGMEQAEQPLEDDLELDGVAYEDLDEVSKEIARERMSEQSQCIRNEVDQYLTDRHVSLTCKTFDVGKWWKGVETTYPILSKLAKDILAVPCSTVASENAFSLGSRVVDPFRASLTPKTVEALVCTSDWLRCAPANFNLYEPPTEDEMVIYHELEELERGTCFVKLSSCYYYYYYYYCFS